MEDQFTNEQLRGLIYLWKRFAVYSQSKYSSKRQSVFLAVCDYKGNKDLVYSQEIEEAFKADVFDAVGF